MMHEEYVDIIRNLVAWHWQIVRGDQISEQLIVDVVTSIPKASG
ncbi:hypothetical protein X765_13660 [Mesorhizobium sp. LSHC440B00]|nr:hypothetical protein X765_13660 [Mesorhizobium sp. LSHC440B00]ESX43259.1 hypothetical protein X764_07440 [Mesorhizobium sp. LSHC440A00]